MKKVISLVLSVLMLMSVLSAGVSAFAEGYVSDSMIKDNLTLVNNFRTGNETWYWDENDSQKVQCSNLAVLQFDINLEKIAKTRAKEIADSGIFDHTRPDGSLCFTCTTTDADGNTVKFFAENIAYGSGMDAAVAFDEWREADKNYAGQGHRRNMLDSRFTAVGIAAYVGKDGKTYWVQVFAKKLSAQTPTQSSTPASSSSSSSSSSAKTVIKKPVKTSISKAKSTKKKTLKLTWKKVTANNSGYEVMISTDKKFKKNYKKSTINSASINTKTFKKLKSKKKYYAKVRCFRKVGGKTYYSAWSPVKTAKVK